MELVRIVTRAAQNRNQTQNQFTREGERGNGIILRMISASIVPSFRYDPVGADCEKQVKKLRKAAVELENSPARRENSVGSNIISQAQSVEFEISHFNQ